MENPKARFIFLTSTGILIFLGLAIMASSSIPLSQANFGQSYYYLKHQALYALFFGLLGFFVFFKIPLKTWRRLALPLFLFAVLLLVLVLIPHIGFSSGGAKRWLNLKIFSFQPSELAKLAVIVFLASWLESKKAKVTKSQSILAILFWVLAIDLLILLEPDYDTFILIWIIGFAMYFAAGAKIKPIAVVLLISLVAFSSLIAMSPYRRGRVLTFLNPSRDTAGKSYQQNQALITIGSGGLLGRGLGHGIQKYNYLPETIGDAVFAIISEELGLLGAGGVLLIFLIWILSGLKIASSSSSLMGEYICVGIVTWIGVQAFINILGILGLMPFSGIPLPFISYGGSALMVEMAAVGLVFNIAKNK